MDGIHGPGTRSITSARPAPKHAFCNFSSRSSRAVRASRKIRRSRTPSSWDGWHLPFHHSTLKIPDIKPHKTETLQDTYMQMPGLKHLIDMEFPSTWSIWIVHKRGKLDNTGAVWTVSWIFPPKSSSSNPPLLCADTSAQQGCEGWVFLCYKFNFGKHAAFWSIGFLLWFHCGFIFHKNIENDSSFLQGQAIAKAPEWQIDAVRKTTPIVWQDRIYDILRVFVIREPVNNVSR